jgi:hypothetical protein
MSRTAHPRRRRHPLTWDAPGDRLSGAVAPWLTRAVAARADQADNDLARLLGVPQTMIRAARASLGPDQP